MSQNCMQQMLMQNN